MKKTSLFITTIAAITIPFQLAAADCLETMRENTLNLRDNFIASIDHELDQTNKSADNIKALPLKGAISGACGGLFEILQTKENFIRGCLNGMKEASIEFNVEGLLDQQQWDDQAATFREYRQYGTCFGPSTQQL